MGKLEFPKLCRSASARSSSGSVPSAVLMSKTLEGKRNWIELASKASRHNCETFRKLIGPKAKLWAVVKSNAYGHGLFVFSRVINGSVDGFCVDSAIEGLRLRREGIRKPILVMGPTLPEIFTKAAAKNIAVTVSNFEALKSLIHSKKPPQFHIKIDTGMHRQGFYAEDLPKVIKQIANRKTQKNDHSQFAISHKLSGIYTHFAEGKDLNNTAYTEKQFGEFKEARELFERAGFKNLIAHCAATGGALLDPRYHLDAVRIGMGLYGYHPSQELEAQLPTVRFRPVLSWRTAISEIKTLKRGDFVGYDLTERVNRRTEMAILPIGYWHGFPRSLSGVGEALVGGCRARVLGRVSMDLTAIDVTGIRCRIGDTVTVIGRSGSQELRALEIARIAGTTHYEFLTRLNPLIEKIVA